MGGNSAARTGAALQGSQRFVSGWVGFLAVGVSEEKERVKQKGKGGGDLLETGLWHFWTLRVLRDRLTRTRVGYHDENFSWDFDWTDKVTGKILWLDLSALRLIFTNCGFWVPVGETNGLWLAGWWLIDFSRLTHLCDLFRFFFSLFLFEFILIYSLKKKNYKLHLFFCSYIGIERGENNYRKL